MKKFEYKHRAIHKSRLENFDDLIVQLNKEGSEGWELATITSDGEYLNCIFKCERPEYILEE